MTKRDSENIESGSTKKSSSNSHDVDRAKKPSSSRDSSDDGGSSRGAGGHFGWVLVISSLALAFLIAFYGFDQRYWLLPPEQKLISSWKSDLQLIKDKNQAALLKRVGQIRLRANDHSPAAEWVERIQAPIEKSKSGDILADVFLIHQIEGHRYGVVVQYEFIDIKTKNKVGEFARTLWLGVYY